MKKGILIALLCLAAVSLAFPQPGYSWGHGRGHGTGHGGGHGFEWYIPGAFIGVALLGALMASPWYAYPPPSAYVYPAPAYAYPAPGPAYAYPPEQGAYTCPNTPGPDRRSNAQNEDLPGEWVTVPGQWVDGTWVPLHKAWVPVN
jgi:hypothetical protein